MSEGNSQEDTLAILEQALVLFKEKRYEEAGQLFASLPQTDDIPFYRALNAQAIGDEQQAITCYAQFLESRKDVANIELVKMALFEQAHMLARHGKLDDALLHYYHLLSKDIGHMPGLLHWVCIAPMVFCWEGMEEILKVLAARPVESAYVDELDQALLHLHHAGYANETVTEFHKQWASFLDQKPYEGTVEKTDKIKIGFISADFRIHPVALFLEPLLKNLDREKFEVHCFYLFNKSDDVTVRFGHLADHWYDVPGMEVKELAAKIKQAGIQVLVDLNGHTANNRLDVLAESPAPLQLSYLGYPNTTGLNTVDYYITDRVCDPEGSESQYTEKLAYLKNFSCFMPPVKDIEIKPAPCESLEIFTFGSFHNVIRLTPTLCNVWATIIKSVPNSRLLIVRRGISQGTIERLTLFFKKAGLNDQQFAILSEFSVDNHLVIYQQVDVTLDTFPWSGHTTACESLWMGVPVVTLSGDSHAGRMVESVLRSVEHPELIAENVQRYIEIACDLAKDREKVSKYRKALREDFLQSSICDAQAFANDFSQLIETLWQEKLSASNS